MLLSFASITDHAVCATIQQEDFTKGGIHIDASMPGVGFLDLICGGVFAELKPEASDYAITLETDLMFKKVFTCTAGSIWNTSLRKESARVASSSRRRFEDLGSDLECGCCKNF